MTKLSDIKIIQKRDYMNNTSGHSGCLKSIVAKPSLLVFSSFLLPLLFWCLVSYVPFIWHPYVLIENPGAVPYFQKGMYVDKADFNEKVQTMRQTHKAVPTGTETNPLYLPAPDKVGKALVSGFLQKPESDHTPWMLSSLWSSIQLVIYSFIFSSLIGIPLGVLCGIYTPVGRLTEPFIEFFRYLPAPAFAPLAVAILGIYSAPKIAIIVIGTLFQQILIIANTTRKLDKTLIEASKTLGARRLKFLGKVVFPGILPDIYRDQRILLGWAWTYLIVAELVGTSSGITWFITQQARYHHFDDVFAAIIVIGVIGYGSDCLLARLGRRFFPWCVDGKNT